MGKDMTFDRNGGIWFMGKVRSDLFLSVCFVLGRQFHCILDHVIE